MVVIIDVETEIFNTIATSLRVRYPGIYIAGEYVRSPSSFPAVLIMEMDNTMYQKTQTTDNAENHVSVMYEVNVYSNRTKGKKSECKEIAAFIDNEFQKLGFTRTMLNPIPNMEDATIYRITARYTAVVSKNKTIYRR